MNKSFYTTKLVVEIEISTQFGPLDAINIVATSLQFPAIKSVRVINCESDYKRLTEQDVQANAMEPGKMPYWLK